MAWSCWWTPAFVASVPGEIVIEAFACELPPTQLEAMAAQAVAPVRINLEYLSAEDWVAGCHGLARRIRAWRWSSISRLRRQHWRIAARTRAAGAAGPLREPAAGAAAWRAALWTAGGGG